MSEQETHIDLTKDVFYHGSPFREVDPVFGLGNDHHDYGRGFYLTDRESLAREWAVCRPDEKTGWVHAWELLMLGGLGIQYCLKSERAFVSVEKADGYPVPVEWQIYNARYNERDRLARDRMDELIAGPKNKAEKVMSTLV